MNLADSYAVAFDLLRYARAKDSPMKLSLYVYTSDEKVDKQPLDFQAWRAFAAWAVEQGPELQRLAREGATDVYRERLSLHDLEDEIDKADIPAEHQVIVKVIIDAIWDGTGGKPSIGLAVKLDNDEESEGEPDDAV